MNYNERINRIIPGGAHTYSRGFDQFPSNAPQILARGEGAYVWDAEGKRFLDYGMGLRAVTLGYANQRVNLAAFEEIKHGNNLTRASLTELKAAEVFTSTIPGAEMVKFAKNGSNVTTAAVKIARAYTKRRYVCVPLEHPFFSFDDWFIGTTPIQRGIPEANASSTLVFNYNDISSLTSLFETYPNEIAAVILEPATTLVPCSSLCDKTMTAKTRCTVCPNRSKNFLHQVQKLCQAEGALFILDEIITGFRWALEGAHYYFDVQPDLMTFGKGMANGFSVAALTGRREVMDVGSTNKPGMERTFLLSSTYGGEMCGLGAFIETMKIYREKDVCSHLWDYGARLRDGLIDLSKENGITDYFQIDGPGICLNYITKDNSGIASSKFRTLFSQEMVKQGVLMPWIAVSLEHGDQELDMTLSAARKALKVYSDALSGSIEKYLVGPEVKPVFRKFN